MKLGPCELNQVYCGNCIDLMAQLPDNSIDLTVTSPPYDNLRTYNGYKFIFEAVAAGLWRITKKGGVVVWVVSDETKNGSESLSSFKQAIFFNELGFNVETMIYQKAGAIPGHNWRAYPSGFEYMFILAKGMPNTFNPIKDIPNSNYGKMITGTRREPNGNLKPEHGIGKVYNKYSMRTNVWRYAAGFMLSTKDKEAFNHPAIFPEALAKDHIVSWSNPGDIVLDPMTGSGTTLKMAKETGRQFLGFESSEEYCKIARRRIAAAKIPLFVSGEDHKIEPVQLDF